MDKIIRRIYTTSPFQDIFS